MEIPESELIAVDMGNSRISCGSFKSGILVKTWFYGVADLDAAAEELCAAKSNTIAVSSVVPEACQKLKKLLLASGKRLCEVRAGDSNLMEGVYSTMGSDRIANAIAARKLYGQDRAAIVIDAGTATTLTAVDREGRFAGGFITLGLGKTITMLHQAGAALPLAGLKPSIDRELCFDTESAILSGTLLGQVGMIEYWVRLAKRRLLNESIVIATGGWSEMISRHSNVFDVCDPVLTLKGVYLIAVEEADRAGRV